MPDRKITDLVDGAPLQPTDEFVVARAGDNFKIDGAEVVAAVTKHDVTLAGNTAGALALVSSGTLTLAGGNNITLSQAGNAVTISALASSSLVAAGDISISTNGNTITISGSTQSVQTQNAVDVTLSGNTSGALALVSSGTLTLAGGNNITLSQAGNAVTISGPNVGGAQTGISGIVGSDATYTSGTVTFSGVGGGVTVNSNTGQRIDISVAAQSVQPETQTFIAGVSASDTLYTSGNVRITGVGGGITVSSNTGQRIDLSVAAQSVQPETQTFIAGISASNTLYTSGNVRISGSQAVTVRSGTGQLVIIDAPAQSVQPETQTFIAGVSASDTLYTSGNVRITGVGGGVTVSSNTGQRVDISVAAPVAQSTQTQGILSVGVSTGGNTAGNTQVSTGSRFVLVASGNATASQATAAGASTVTISVGAQTVQTNDIPRMGVSTGGNTSGDTTINSGTRLVFVGSNNITLSQGTAASATTITISGPNVGGNYSAGMSTNGNTSGDTGYASQRLNLVGGNNITLSGSTNGGSMSLTISAPNLGAGAMSAGVSTGGNTAGATGITGTQLVLVGVSPMSLSQTTGANGGTVSINAPATSSLSATGAVNISTNGSTISIGVPLDTLSYFDPNGAASKVVGVFPGNASLAMQPWTVINAYQHDRVVYPVQYSQATNSTLTVTVSGWFGLYTRNASTLSLFTSGSNTFSINGSGTASSAQNSGLKFLTFGWTDTITPGDYWLAAVSRTTTAGANASLSNVAIAHGLSNSAWSGLMGVAANSTNQIRLGLGTYTATTAGLPASIAFSQLAGSTSAAQRAPWVWFLSQSV